MEVKRNTVISKLLTPVLTILAVVCFALCKPCEVYSSYARGGMDVKEKEAFQEEHSENFYTWSNKPGWWWYKDEKPRKKRVRVKKKQIAKSSSSPLLYFKVSFGNCQ